MSLRLLILVACAAITPSAFGGDPWQMSYERVPGFHSSLQGENLEWAFRSAKQPDEPDVPISKQPPIGLRIKWLGTAGFEISDDETTILIDPFLTRSRTADTLLLRKLDIDTRAVDEYALSTVDLSKVRAILNAHTHHDHVQDIPYVLSKYARSSDRPLVVGDPNVRRLLDAYKDPRCEIPWLIGVDPLGDTPQYTIDFDLERRENPPPGQPVGYYVGEFGNFKVTAFINRHALYDLYPFFKVEGDIDEHPPLRSSDYKAYLSSTLTYLIEYKGKFRIFASDSAGFLNWWRISREVGKVDLVLQGIAARENMDDTARYLGGLEPKYFVPAHYDNFLEPFQNMKELDYKIMLTDHSELAKFLMEFNSRYVKEAEQIAGAGFVPPKLRMLKALYYYSLEGLLQDEQKH